MIEGWLTIEAGCELVASLSQLYVKRNKSGEIILLVAKLTDDLLLAGTHNELRAFTEQISARFKISKTITTGEIKFNGCTITKNNGGDIQMTMDEYAQEITAIEISKGKKADGRSPATTKEISAFRKLAGLMVWIGSGVSPMAEYHT